MIHTWVLHAKLETHESVVASDKHCSTARELSLFT